MTTTDIHIALQALAARVEALEARLAAQPVATTSAAPAPASATVSVADDYDLDSPYGDPEVRRDPPRWKGEPMAGKRYSQTSPAFLECIAGFLEWAASQAEAKGEMTTGGKPRAPYLRRDAARARGWRLRLIADEQQQAPRVETRTSSAAARAKRAAEPAKPLAPARYVDVMPPDATAGIDDEMPF